MRRCALGLCLLAALTLASSASAAGTSMTKLSNVTIKASDGVNLVGDVYLPGQGKGRYPAVVDMEPYGRSTSTAYVPQGYARVNTDVRGSGMSGGALCLLCLREQEDVRDVVEWIARQPWSNGHVALYGYSYSAITALLGAALEPKHLDAVIVGHPPTDPYRDVVWQNGLYDQGFVYQWFAGQTAAQSIGIGYQPQVLDRAQQQFAIETRLIPYDGPVYYERSVLAKVRRIKVPVYIFTGWEDMYSRGDMRLIDSLRTPSLLVINASTHHGTDEAGELGAPYGGSIPNQVNNISALSDTPPPGEDIAWLNRWVKGSTTASRRSRVCGTSISATALGMPFPDGMPPIRSSRTCTSRPRRADPRRSRPTTAPWPHGSRGAEAPIRTLTCMTRRPASQFRWGRTVRTDSCPTRRWTSGSTNRRA